MLEAVLKFYGEELKKYPFYHQTINDGKKKQFVCFFNAIKKGILTTIETPDGESFKCCPCCGEELGSPMRMENGKKIVWR